MDIISFKDSYGNNIYVEIDEPSNNLSNEYGDTSVPVGGVGTVVHDAIETAKSNFEDACVSIGPTLSTLYNQIRNIPSAPNEVSLELGFKLSADAGFVLAKLDSEVSIKITAKWKDSAND